MSLARGFFRHGSNGLLFATLAGFAVIFAWQPRAFSALAFSIGFFVFLVTEYTTHRFTLHAPPHRSSFVRSLQHRLHYDHHLTPERLDLLFLPPRFAVPAALAFFGVYFALTRSATLALALLFGSLLALLYYEWVHYVAHVPFQPITLAGRWMKKYHLLHHFKNEPFRGPCDAPKSGTTRHSFDR